MIGVIRYSAGSFQDALDLVERKLVDLRPFVTKRLPLTKTKDAIEELKNGEEVKIVIYNNLAD
jgi:D-xylulose reductase